MTVFAAILLGISLVFMGIVIIGDAAGWWKVDENVFGWLAVILATASKWITQKVKKSGEPATVGSPESSEDKNGARGSAVLLALSVLVAIPGCAGMSDATKASLSTYGGCVGNKAIECVAAATGASIEEKAKNYSACMAGHAVGCIPIATAQQNPPAAKSSISIDLVCLDSVFQNCADDENRADCIKAAAQKCGGQK